MLPAEGTFNFLDQEANIYQRGLYRLLRMRWGSSCTLPPSFVIKTHNICLTQHSDNRLWKCKLNYLQIQPNRCSNIGMLSVSAPKWLLKTDIGRYEQWKKYSDPLLKVKVPVRQRKNTLLQVKVLHLRSYLSKSAISKMYLKCQK